ncbi:hypothetical protein KCP70_12430 [Salmonella enterica subsp. enterica]|nr:hypothetical protein KCP70_12430 [Salmonella enterica subsp. enterica]
MTPSCAIRRRNASTTDRRLRFRAGGGERLGFYSSFNWLMTFGTPQLALNSAPVCMVMFACSSSCFRYWHHTQSIGMISFGRRILVNIVVNEEVSTPAL